MAVRIVALLIPLAIILPQLQASRPPAAGAEEHDTHVQPATASEWSYETRRSAEAASTRVVLEAPAHEAMRTLDSPAPIAALQAALAPSACQAPSPRAAPKLARPASFAKGTATATAWPRPASNHAKNPASQAGCEPLAHCAPVEVAKVTPVSRRAL